MIKELLMIAILAALLCLIYQGMQPNETCAISITKNESSFFSSIIPAINGGCEQSEGET